MDRPTRKHSECPACRHSGAAIRSYGPPLAARQSGGSSFGYLSLYQESGWPEPVGVKGQLASQVVERQHREVVGGLGAGDVGGDDGEEAVEGLPGRTAGEGAPLGVCG